MKNLFYNKLLKTLSVFAVSLILFNGCKPDADMPTKPEMEVSEENFILGKDGGTITFTLTTNRAWVIAVSGNKTIDEKEWCSITPLKGEAGTHTITVTVIPEEDENADARVTKLQVVASATGKMVRIVQSGKPVVLTSEAKDVYEKSAVIGGVWGYADEIEILEIGAAYKQESETDFTYQASDDKGVEKGAIVVSLSDLTPETKYVFKAYIKDKNNTYFYGEDKEFTTPGLPVFEKISNIRALGSDLKSGGTKTIEHNGILRGIVVSDHAGGNIDTLRFAFTDGETGNSGIFIALPTVADNTYLPGDSLNIRTKGAILKKLNQNVSYQLEVTSEKITKTSSDNPVSAIVVSHVDLANYEAMYVEIQNTQITKNFMDETQFPVWNDGALFNYDMEVNGSEYTYVLNVLSTAGFASDPVIRKSGTLKGIVSNMAATSSNKWAAVYPRNNQDLSGLTQERFNSMLELRFGVPAFSGRMYTFSEISNTKISIPYYNGDGSIIANTITAAVSGTGAEGITVSSVSNYKLANGSGSIDLIIGGTPQVAGDVTFTISGLETYLGENNTCTATVAEAEKPDGNFEAFWNTAGLAKPYGNANTTPLAVNNNNSSVTVSNLVSRNFDTSGSGSWGDCWGGINWAANTNDNKLYPEKDAQFTVTVADGKTLSLVSLDMTTRVNGGVESISVQYKIDNGTYTEINLLLSGDESKKSDLKEIAGLQNITSGETVTFRIVPIGGTATGKWAINKNDITGKSLSLVGNIE